MNINQHNYEEFFLLYVDNELNEVERKAVEAFAQQHRELGEELEMLQQTILPVSNQEIFTGKEQLIKKESGITTNNYEEYFLSYVDGELNQNDVQAVETFVLQHPGLQEEFTLLKQTILPAQVIDCPFKQELYKAEKSRRVIPIYWTRIAVAAAFIGIAALLWTIAPPALNNNTSSGLVATNGKPLINHEANESAKKGTTNSGNEQLVQNENTTTGNAATRVPFTTDKANKKQTQQLEAPSTQVDRTQNQELLAIKAPVTKEDRTTAPVEIIDRNIATLTSENAATASSTKSVAEPNNVFRTASYTAIDEEEEDDNVLLIAGGEFNKKKVLGLLKKATNLFDKKQNKGESERTIQIASFEIKTK